MINITQRFVYVWANRIDIIDTCLAHLQRVAGIVQEDENV